MFSQAVVAHAFEPPSQHLGGRGKQISGLQSEFQDSQGYTEKPCLEKPKKKKVSFPFKAPVLNVSLEMY
jgi:hypothetical protein